MALRNHAQEVFRSDTRDFQDLVPRQKFNFRLLFETNDAQWEVLRVVSVTMPGFNFDTQIMHQYNKKRVIQSKMNFDPITVTFYDSGKGIDYFNETAREVIDPIYTTSMGYNPTNAIGRYFFTRIIVEQAGNANVTNRQTILKNPIITTVQSDTLSYADSQPTTFTVTFQPESIHVKEV